jgi:hypothetical protein
MPSSNSAPANKEGMQGERQLLDKVFKEWGGCYTRSARTAMPKDRWYYLINLQPIGPANVQTIPNIGPVMYDFASDSAYWGDYANLANIDYIYTFTTNGKIFQTTISSGVTTQINSGHLLSGAGSRLAQWSNTVVLFIDTNGLFSWDGTTFTHITVSGAPPSGQAIAVYEGIVWVAQGRNLIFSVAAGTNGPGTGYGNNANDWNIANGAGVESLTDPTIRSAVTQMKAENGYLYVIGRTSVNIIGDVQVVAGSSPPTPVFTNLNIQSIIGTDQPGAVFSYNRTLMFANRYGTFALEGTTALKLSDDIDGTWLDINFAQQVSGGQCVINNILTAAFLIKLNHDPSDAIASNPFTSGEYLLAMWWADKWWFANMGSLTFTFSAFSNNVPTLFGYAGNKLHALFTDTTTSPSTVFIGPLWDMDVPISDKQTIKAGMEMVVKTFYGNIELNVDTENTSTAIDKSGQLNSVTWINDAGDPIQWVNNANQPVEWFASGYVLFWGTTPGAFAKYVGLSGSTSGASFQLSALMMDYLYAARW